MRLRRPSLPWCFPVRGLCFCAVFSRPRTAFWSGTQVAQKSSFSMGFRSYVREFFAAFFAPSPSFTAMVFPCPGAVFLRGLFSPKNRVLERDPSPHFLWVSEVTLGSFSPPSLRLRRPSLPWCFPVRGLCFCAVFSRPRTAFWSGTQVAKKSSFSMGFRSYVREFFAAFFAPSPSFTAMVFPCPGAVFLRDLFSPKNRVLERDPSSSEILIFYGFQKLR